MHAGDSFNGARMPTAEAAVLRIRDHLPDHADEILCRAREHSKSFI